MNPPVKFAYGRFRRAFTLLELMVVIVLMGIVAAAILPEMKGTYEDALLRSVSRELVDVLSLSYSRAVSLNRPHRLQLDAKGKYQVEQKMEGRGPEEEYVAVREPGCYGALDERITVRLRKTPSDQEQEEEQPVAILPDEPAPPDAIRFLPDGTSDAASISLRDRHGFGLNLTLNPVTSRVSVEREGRAAP